MICLHKQEEEATVVGAAQHEEETHLKDIQCQVYIYSYTGTLSDFSATNMETFTNRCPDKQQN